MSVWRIAQLVKLRHISFPKRLKIKSFTSTYIVELKKGIVRKDIIPISKTFYYDKNGRIEMLAIWTYNEGKESNFLCALDWTLGYNCIVLFQFLVSYVSLIHLGLYKDFPIFKANYSSLDSKKEEHNIHQTPTWRRVKT